MKIFSATLKGTTTVSQGTTNLSGSFTGSFSGSIAGIAGDVSNYSSSVALRTTTLEAASGSFSTRTTNIERVYATTGSNTFTGAQVIQGTLTAQTLVVQTVTSSVLFTTGSNRLGSSLSNVQELTGSVGITGSLSVNTNGTEFQVSAGGVNIGNALTDNHVVSGSFTINPNGLFVSSSGNVGIGVTSISPISTYKTLEIRGAAGGGIKIGRTGYNPLNIQQDGGDAYLNNVANGAIYFYTNDSEKMSITSGGSVRINTTVGVATLNLKSQSSGAIIRFQNNAGGDGTIFAYGTSTSLDYAFNTYSVGNAFYIANGGNVGIGLSSPGEKLHIYGGGLGPELRMEGTWGSHWIRAYSDNFNLYTAGGRQAISMNNAGSVFNYNNTTTWQQTSDIRVKENINTISNALDVITSLNPVSFNYKQEFAEKNNWDDSIKLNNIGFIAQEFETVFPKYVYNKEYSLGDSLIEDFKSIDTGHLVPFLVKAIQEQQAQID